MIRRWFALGGVLAAIGLLGAAAGPTDEFRVHESQSEAISPGGPTPNTPDIREQLRRERSRWARLARRYRAEIRALRRVAGDVRYPSPAGNRRLARAYFGPEYPCAAEIIDGETAGTWNETIWNYEGSGAYGLGQALPRSKMLAYGGDAYRNPLTQLEWFEGYAVSRYGSVCAAAAHWTPAGSW